MAELIGPGRQLNWQQRQELRRAATKFNIDPKTGIDYLVQVGIIENTPEQVARLFHDVEGLSKRRIGEFVAKPVLFNQRCAEAWLASFDFTGMSVDTAMRTMVRKMRLPGEAQQIDRIMEKFATVYNKQNPGVFTSRDTVYVVAFSVIMLNTDLHNQHVATKMTLDQFIFNNRGLDDGKDLPRPFLAEVYHRIKAEAIRMDEDDMYESEEATFVAPLKSGWLWKLGRSKLGGWHKHWFVLTDGCLYYFNSRQDRNPRAIIPLESCRIATIGGSSNQLGLTRETGALRVMKRREDGAMQYVTQKQLLLKMSSVAERQAWLSAFQEAIRNVEMMAQASFSDAMEGVKEPNTDDDLISEATSMSPTTTMTSGVAPPSIARLFTDKISTLQDLEAHLQSKEDLTPLERVAVAAMTLELTKLAAETPMEEPSAAEQQQQQQQEEEEEEPSTADVLKSSIDSTSSASTPAYNAKISSILQGDDENARALFWLQEVCTHVNGALLACDTVQPIKAGLTPMMDADPFVGMESIISSLKSNRDVLRWAHDAERLCKKFERQTSYNMEVLAKLQSLERAVSVTCRILPSTTEETVCEAYGDNEVGLLDSNTNLWQSYGFDKVWAPSDPAAHIYRDVKPLLTSIVRGHRACLITYGFGKFNSDMLLGGSSKEASDVGDHGLIYQAACSLFEMTTQLNEQTHELEKVLLMSPKPSPEKPAASFSVAAAQSSSEDEAKRRPAGSKSMSDMVVQRRHSEVIDDDGGTFNLCLSAMLVNSTTMVDLLDSREDASTTFDRDSGAPMAEVQVVSNGHLDGLFVQILSKKKRIEAHGGREWHLVVKFDAVQMHGKEDHIGNLILIDTFSSTTAGEALLETLLSRHADVPDPELGQRKEMSNTHLMLIRDLTEAIEDRFQRPDSIPTSPVVEDSEGALGAKLQGLLGSECMTMLLTSVASDLKQFLETRDTLNFSKAINGTVGTSSGERTVEAEKIEVHIRELKTRQASARHSGNTLTQDLSELMDRKKAFKYLQGDVMTRLEPFEKYLKQLSDAMKSQLGLMNARVEHMTVHLENEFGVRDRHISHFRDVRSTLKAIIAQRAKKSEESSEGDGDARTEGESVQASDEESEVFASALLQSQELMESTLDEMHPTVIEKIIAHDPRRHAPLRGRSSTPRVVSRRKSAKIAVAGTGSGGGGGGGMATTPLRRGKSASNLPKTGSGSKPMPDTPSSHSRQSLEVTRQKLGITDPSAPGSKI